MNYFERMKEKTNEAYAIAKEARSKGLDPTAEVETPQAEDLADRVEGLVGPNGIAERIRELQEEGKSRDEIEFQVIKEIINEENGNKSNEEKISQAVRTAVSIETEGVTVAGKDGISDFKINKNKDGSDYVAVLFAGPIRSAGGTASAKAIIFTDYARKLLGIGRYQPTREEQERYWEEIEIYHNQITRLQYYPSEKEVKTIVKNCPVCIDGVPTEKKEVGVYKNLERVKTNRVRGGMCLVVGEGIAQKKKKVLRITNKHQLEWKWLETMIEVKKKDVSSAEDEENTITPITKYLRNTVGGRPIFSYPLAPGGFRLRYGHSRTNGIAAKSIHPAATVVLDRFPAHGTQIRTERPGKAMALTVCDTIEPPIVKLKNGDVLRVETIEKADEVEGHIEEILFLGDMLITYGDFLEENHKLVPSGICEEWWVQLAEKEGVKVSDPYKVTLKQAIKLSKEHKIPLHPRFTYHYNDVSKEEIKELRNWLMEKGEVSKYKSFNDEEVLQLTVNNQDKKRILEECCIPHKVEGNTIKIEEGESIVETLGLKKDDLDIERISEEAKDALELINNLSEFPVYNKTPVYIGTRIGRTEKAKPRKMSPPPHGLTPVGQSGGNQRLVNKAAEAGSIKIEKARLICPECGEETFSYRCRDCGAKAKLVKTCTKCGRVQEEGKKCDSCGSYLKTHHNTTVNMKKELAQVLENLKDVSNGDNNTIKLTTNESKKIAGKIKGIKGLTNEDKLFEALEKTVLRAKHGVYVFRDGTVRFDAVDLPITHFKPKEVGVSVEKFKELGYVRDHEGNRLRRDDQILELKPQDILIPKDSIKYLMNTSQFIDELLEKYYHMEPYYNVKNKEDLVGCLVAGLAPHICVGVLGRIVGFSRARALYAHPYFHCAKRRNCDGDEDSFMLLLDLLLNFSQKYLPNRPGAAQDAPLVLSIKINPMEIDDEVHALETVYNYPLEFYDATQKMKNPADVDIETVGDRVDTEKAFKGLGFTHDTTQYDAGVTASTYTTLHKMDEKVRRQMDLGKRIRAVDEKDMAERLINSHFMKDIYGNLRAFGQQTFRCVGCNKKFRRVPLIGKCTSCGGKILLTVHKKGIEKYLNISSELAEEFMLSDYLKQRLKLVKQDLDQIFQQRKSQQSSLDQFS